MAKILDASKILPGCMDRPNGAAPHYGMAKGKTNPKARLERADRRPLGRTYIRQWRKFRGMTLERLAERVDMTAGNLSQIERGNQPYSQSQLEALAEALQTDVASLLMRDPTDSEALWSIWDQAKQGQRRQIVEISRTILKTGTDE
jgi:transcriptional regulator with XRE-family HTH domain